ncbi:hypothetical protein IJG79_02230 [Candidatus Saccharibacteria bacterium]|nr:hypothetical protein [Candidatus Saccharibacteria bacterium]
MKNKATSIIIASVVALAVGLLAGCLIWNSGEHLPTLPKPELSEGQRGELGIDKNINESNIDKYLGRSDSVYYDLRMLEDPAKYENIDGDSYLSGMIKGFEVVPYPYISQVVGLPEAVGEPYSGPTLFRIEGDNYIANYREAMQIITDLFPKDKNIFLMCGGGGYAGMMKKMLVKLGWDTNKIYDIGGYWNYDGKNKIEIKETLKDGTTYYAFWKVPYHEIDFSNLTKI